jgi:serine/threonine protein kinase
MGLVSRTRIGSYEIVALIGSGGMGEVYQARDTRLDRIVALKVITGGASVDPELRTRFEREARAIASLNHPNICVLHDVGRERPLRPEASTETPDASEPPLDFLVMEYLEGETLATRLARSEGQPALSVDQALQIAIPSRARSTRRTGVESRIAISSPAT